MLPSAFASEVGAVSRFGPTVPVAPAGWNVWHVAHPFAAKTALPAAAFPPPPADVVVAAVVVAACVVVAAAVVVGVVVAPPTVTVCTTVFDELPRFV
jgi:hypothetical protein